jgi:hypothetical protein
MGSGSRDRVPAYQICDPECSTYCCQKNKN